MKVYTIWLTLRNGFAEVRVRLLCRVHEVAMMAKVASATSRLCSSSCPCSSSLTTMVSMEEEGKREQKKECKPLVRLR